MARRIAVVGGGPAGATCARILAASGATVSLFEARGSSEKPCGGGVPASAVEEFPELADPALPRRVVREIRIYSPSNRCVPVRLEDGIHVFRRHELDSHLRRLAGLAGAALRATRVRSVGEKPEGWEIVTDDGPEGPFDHLVGADGVNGVVRRAVAGPFDDDQLTLALYAYVPGVARPEMVLKFFGDFDGYLWVFPRTDHVSVGICAMHRRVGASRLRDELRRFVEDHYPEGRFDPEALKGYFIPATLHPPAARAGGRWALAGDAAGFVDRLTREGIAWAMRSGAETARRLVTPPVPADLGWSHRFAGGFFRRDFLESMARLASASGSIRRVLADLFEGRQRYAGLKRRLLLNAVPCGLQVSLLAASTLLKLRGGGRIQ